MASARSPLRAFVKPLLYKVLGRRGYVYAQLFGKIRDIEKRLVEEKEMCLLPELVREGDTVVDIGANFAYYTVRLSELVGPRGHVYGFEPIPFTFQVCTKVLKHFRTKNVSLFERGVGAKNERLSFDVPVVSFGGISAGLAHIGTRVHEAEGKEEYYDFDRHEAVECEVVRLDDFLLPKLVRLSFVKIDIEGAEFFAFLGMKEVLKKFKPHILVEMQPYFLKGFGITEEDILNLIGEMGYETFYFDKDLSKLRPLTTALWSDNFVLIHSTRRFELARLIHDERQSARS